jgi:hypothetical protein
VPDAQLGHGDVEASGATAAITADAAQDLGQNAVRRTAASKDVAMIAMRGEDRIVSTQGRACARRGCFLADRHVDVAVNQPSRISGETDDGFFEAADAEHRSQQAEFI